MRLKFLPLTALFLSGLLVGLLVSRIWLHSRIGDLLTILALFGLGLAAATAFFLTGYLVRAGDLPLWLRQVLGMVKLGPERSRKVEQAQKEGATRTVAPASTVGPRSQGWPGEQMTAARAKTESRRVTPERFQGVVQVGNLRLRFALSLGFLSVLQNSRLDLAQLSIPRLPSANQEAVAASADVPSTWNAVPFRHPIVLLVALALGVLGQILVSQGDFVTGLISYLLVFALIIGWALQAHVSWEKLLGVPSLSRRAATILLFAVIVVAFAARFYHLDTLPYGIEGDTKGWVLQSYLSVVRHEVRGVFFDHFRFLPVTFYLQGWAMQIFGLDYMVPRYLNAAMSLLAVVLFYFMMRRMTNTLTALTAMLLGAVAFAEMSGARQALHDTIVEFWVIASYFLLLVAIDSRDWRWFLAAGGITAIGMLTYETYYLTPVVALTYLLFRTLLDRKNWRSWLRFIATYLLPLVLVIRPTLEYIGMRQDYHLQVFRQAEGIGLLLPTLWERLLESVRTLFYAVVWQDSLLRWDGPFFNPWLLPFLVTGFVVASSAWRKSHMAFLPLWFILQYFPFGVLGQPFPRVFYPAVFALAGLSGIGLVAALGAVRLSFLRINTRVLVGSFALALIVFVIKDVNTFSARLTDAADRQKRRELDGLMRESAATAPMTYLTYMPFANDVVVIEKDMAEFSVAGVRGLENPGQYFALLELDKFLAQLWDTRGQYDTVNFIFDKTSGDEDSNAPRRAMLDVVRRCYSPASVQTGLFFDLYQISADELEGPLCFSTAQLKPTKPAGGQIVAAEQPITFVWSLGGGTATDSRVVIQQHKPDVIWIEAEDFSKDQGWFEDNRFAGDYSGRGFLLDNYKAGRASYTVAIPSAGRYQVWVRSYRRQIDDHHIFLNVENQPHEFALGGPNSFNRWIWESVGSFDLSASQETLNITREYGKSPQFSIFVDAVIVTSDLGFDPRRDDVWKTVLDSGEQPSSAEQLAVPGGLKPGNYRWRAEVFDGDNLVDSSGQRGLWTPYTEFAIR